MSIRKTPKARHQDLRESIAPGSTAYAWPRPDKQEKGWASVPRSLPLILGVLNNKELSGDANVSLVYLDLLCRNREGLIEILDESEHASRCGIGLRRWRDRLKILADLGFIEVHPKGKKPFGFVVIIHPNSAMDRLHRLGRVDAGTWNDFSKLLSETNATDYPVHPENTAKLSVMDGGALASGDDSD